MFLSKFSSFIFQHLSLLLQITLCSNQYLADCLACISFYLLDPPSDVLEALFVVDAVCKNDACCAFVVSLGDVAEALLACRIPDLELDLGLVDMYGLEFEIDADSGYIAVLEDSVTELGE
jgi:hypothetical protein